MTIVKLAVQSSTTEISGSGCRDRARREGWGRHPTTDGGDGHPGYGRYLCSQKEQTLSPWLSVIARFDVHNSHLVSDVPVSDTCNIHSLNTSCQDRDPSKSGPSDGTTAVELAPRDGRTLALIPLESVRKLRSRVRLDCAAGGGTASDTRQSPSRPSPMVCPSSSSGVPVCGTRRNRPLARSEGDDSINQRPGRVSPIVLVNRDRAPHRAPARYLGMARYLPATIRT